MFGLGQLGRLGLSGGGGSTPAMPGGALGIWYADEYVSSPRRYIPNAVASTTPLGLFNGTRRLFSNNTLWDVGGCAVTDMAVIGPDGATQDATTVVAAGFWQIGKANVNLPAGTYTIGLTAKRNTGTDQEFISLVGSSKSVVKYATASWQRFSHTFTVGAGPVNIYPLWSAASATIPGATDCNIQLYEANLYAGSVDLGVEPLVGNMVLGKDGFSTNPAVSGNELDLSASGFASFQFDAAKTLPNALTYVIMAEQVTTTNDYATLLYGFNAGAFDKLQAWMSYNKETLEWAFNGSQAQVQREPSLLFNGKGLHGFSFRYDGAAMDVFVDDVHFTTQLRASLGSLSVADFLVGQWGGSRSNHKLYAAALYDRALSNTELRQAYAFLKAKATAAALSATPMSRVIVAEGDSITAPYIEGAVQSYAYKYGANANPFAYTIVRAFPGDAVAQLESRAADIDAIIPPSVSGREFVLSVLCGANDFDDGLTTSQFLAAYASYLDDRRAAGFPVAVGTILPRTAPGFNTWRNTCNTEIRLWATGGSTVPGIHADAIIDFAAEATMGPDAAASNATYYSDGTHPTNAGQVLLEVVYRAVMDAL